MTQEERLDYLVAFLLQEREEYKGTFVPERTEEKRRLLRSLMNLRPSAPIGMEFLQVQDEYLQEEIRRKRITHIENLKPVGDGIFLWKGDITTLAIDAIVNAANRQMLGCFMPCHDCVDNAIHSYAGIQLRLECADLMRKQAADEKTGGAKITKAYNLPCRYVLHTVGPIIKTEPTLKDEKLLASCYQSCMELAEQNGVSSIAFCCISTGEFHFPNKRAAEIAVETVKKYQSHTANTIKVVFNVFKETDYRIYRKLLL